MKAAIKDASLLAGLALFVLLGFYGMMAVGWIELDLVGIA